MLVSKTRVSLRDSAGHRLYHGSVFPCTAWFQAVCARPESSPGIAPWAGARSRAAGRSTLGLERTWRWGAARRWSGAGRWGR